MVTKNNFLHFVWKPISSSKLLKKTAPLSTRKPNGLSLIKKK